MYLPILVLVLMITNMKNTMNPHRMIFGTPGIIAPVDIQLKELLLIFILYPLVKEVATPRYANIMASVTINEGSRSATIRLPFTMPDTRPIKIATIISKGPPDGKRYAATIDEEESIVPMDRSMLPIKIGNVSPAATSRNTVDTVRIPVMFRIFAKNG
jgi:hypothetical protein